MNNWLYIGLAATLLIIVGLSVWSGKQAKKDTKNSAPVVAGVIMGTLVAALPLWELPSLPTSLVCLHGGTHWAQVFPV